MTAWGGALQQNAGESGSDGGAGGWLDGGDEYKTRHAAAIFAAAENAEK